jgi:hypothetical protein
LYFVPWKDFQLGPRAVQSQDHPEGDAGTACIVTTHLIPCLPRTADRLVNPESNPREGTFRRASDLFVHSKPTRQSGVVQADTAAERKLRGNPFEKIEFRRCGTE